MTETLENLNNIEKIGKYEISYRERLRDFIAKNGSYGEITLGVAYSFLAAVELLHGNIGQSVANAAVAVAGYKAGFTLEEARRVLHIY